MVEIDCDGRRRQQSLPEVIPVPEDIAGLELAEFLECSFKKKGGFQRTGKVKKRLVWLYRCDILIYKPKVKARAFRMTGAIGSEDTIVQTVTSGGHRKMVCRYQLVFESGTLTLFLKDESIHPWRNALNDIMDKLSQSFLFKSNVQVIQNLEKPAAKTISCGDRRHRVKEGQSHRRDDATHEGRSPQSNQQNRYELAAHSNEKSTTMPQHSDSIKENVRNLSSKNQSPHECITRRLCSTNFTKEMEDYKSIDISMSSTTSDTTQSVPARTESRHSNLKTQTALSTSETSVGSAPPLPSNAPPPLFYNDSGSAPPLPSNPPPSLIYNDSGSAPPLPSNSPPPLFYDDSGSAPPLPSNPPLPLFYYDSDSAPPLPSNPPPPLFHSDSGSAPPLPSNPPPSLFYNDSGSAPPLPSNPPPPLFYDDSGSAPPLLSNAPPPLFYNDSFLVPTISNTCPLLRRTFSYKMAISSSSFQMLKDADSFNSFYISMPNSSQCQNDVDYAISSESVFRTSENSTCESSPSQLIVNSPMDHLPATITPPPCPFISEVEEIQSEFNNEALLPKILTEKVDNPIVNNFDGTKLSRSDIHNSSERGDREKLLGSKNFAFTSSYARFCHEHTDISISTCSSIDENKSPLDLLHKTGELFQDDTRQHSAVSKSFDLSFVEEDCWKQSQVPSGSEKGEFHIQRRKHLET